MKIEHLKIIDYQGLGGQRQYNFPEKLVVLAAPNGTGKTSIINAIRYGITGDAQPGIMITDKAAKCDIGLDLASGTQIIRELPRKGQGTPKQWLNRRPVEKKVLEAAISSETGVTAGAIKTVTASELVGHMKPADLGDFMLSYIPETLDGPTVASYIPGCTKGMAEEIAAFFPEKFGVDMLDRFYKHCYERRREEKQRKAEIDGQIKAAEGAVRPAETEEALKAQLQRIKETAECVAKYKAELSAYNTEMARRSKTNQDIAALEERLKEYPLIEKEPQIAGTKIEYAPKFRDDLAQAKESLAVAVTQLETTKRAIEALSGSLCPLSASLKCTTDKTPLIEELTVMRTQQEETLERALEKVEAHKKLIEIVEKEIAEYNRNLKIWQERENISARIKALKDSLGPEPKAPVKPDFGDLPSESDVRRKLDLIRICDNKDKLNAEAAKFVVKVADYDALVNAFAPKGIVRESVTSAYIDAFEDSCNRKAEELRHGMKMKFIKGNGITPMLDVNGNGYYYPYPALSGGERVYMIFLLLDMFNSMTGLRIMFLDELSVLDKNNFEALVNVLKEHSDDYDQIFMTLVDHDPLMDVVYRHGLVPVSITEPGTVKPAAN